MNPNHCPILVGSALVDGDEAVAAGVAGAIGAGRGAGRSPFAYRPPFDSSLATALAAPVSAERSPVAARVISQRTRVPGA